MKIRAGFVSNSSSISFIICKENLTKPQIKAFKVWVKSGYYSESRNHFIGQIDYHYKKEFYADLKGIEINVRLVEWYEN